MDFGTTPGTTSIDPLLSYLAFGPDGLAGPIRRWFKHHPLPTEDH